MTLALGQIWLNFTSVVFEEMNCYKRFTDGRSNTAAVKHLDGQTNAQRIRTTFEFISGKLRAKEDV